MTVTVRCCGVAVVVGAGGNVVATNIEATMRNNNATAYVRLPFSTSGPAGFTALSLQMRYNDGYKAYLNGVEIAAKNTPEITSAARTKFRAVVVELDFISGQNLANQKGKSNAFFLCTYRFAIRRAGLF